MSGNGGCEFPKLTFLKSRKCLSQFQGFYLKTKASKDVSGPLKSMKNFEQFQISQSVLFVNLFVSFVSRLNYMISGYGSETSPSNKWYSYKIPK